MSWAPCSGPLPRQARRRDGIPASGTRPPAVIKVDRDARPITVRDEERAVGDHLGTTRPARGQTTRTSTGRAHGTGTTTDQDKRLLPRPGGPSGFSALAIHAGRRAATA
jgi:hypothetical protein